MLALVALLAIACAADAADPTDLIERCPLTIPSQPSFVPPEPYPPEAPAIYKSVWYGTYRLWTMLDPDGGIWTGLPKTDGVFGEKTLWWSDNYSVASEPLTVTGRQLDGSASFESEAGGSGTGGFRDGLGSFMLVGVEIPAAGCWELTAQYRDADLSYVVAVEG